MRNNRFFKKKNLIFGLCGSIVLASPLILTSCSKINYVSNTISKGDGTKFASNLSLTDAVRNALNNESGQQALLSEVANNLAYQWMELSAEVPGQSQYQSLLEDQKRITNNEYKELLESYKDKETDSNKKKNWELLFQQNELDNSGGTEASWKEAKNIKWAKEQLSSLLFKNDYSVVVKTDTSTSTETILIKPTYKEILNALGEKEGYKFAFHQDAVKANNDFSAKDVEYAKFQQFIFEKWVEVENPYVVNIAEWNYSTPNLTGGISGIYNVPVTSSGDGENSGDSSSKSITKDGEDSGEGDGEETPSTQTSGSYSFPYFLPKDQTNDWSGTMAKFESFKNGKSNFDLEGDAGSYGLKGLLTDVSDSSSSSYKLVKNSSLQQDLPTMELAAASAYLYGIAGKTSPSEQQVTEKKISRNLVETATNGFDLITSNFISQSSFKSSSNNGTNDYDSSEINEIHLNQKLVEKIINNKGPLSSYITKDLYAIDGFKINNTNLNEFMFLRDSGGAKAIALDGYKHINNNQTNGGTPSNSSKSKKQRAGDIILYHNMVKKSNITPYMDIKLSGEGSQLETFFKDNFDYLVLEYAFNKTYEKTNIKTKNDYTKQGMFNINDESFIKSLEGLDGLIKALNKYIFESKRWNKRELFISKMVETKSVYSKNFGYSTSDNGFASEWIYSIETTSSTNNYLNNDYNFEISKVVEYVSRDLVFGNNGSMYQYNQQLSSYFSNKTIEPLKSSFGGFQYSQIILSNNKFLNAALSAYADNSSALSNDIKIDKISQYVGSNFFSFNDKHMFKLGDGSGISSDERVYLEESYIQNYFNSEFSVSQIPWLKFNPTNNENNSLSKEDLLKYKMKLWTDTYYTSQNSSQNRYLSFLTTLATTKYILENENIFFDYLQSKIPYGKLAYFVWQSSQNITLNKSDSNYNSVESMLNASNLKLNVNNTENSAYIGSNPNSQTNGLYENNDTSVFGMDTTSYYNISANMLGFKGLQTESSNSLNSVISKRLFDNPKIDNDNFYGLFYAYESNAKMVEYVKSITSSSKLNDFAKTLANKIGNLEMSEFYEKDKSLNDKKQYLINLIMEENANFQVIKSEMFQPRQINYVGIKENGTNSAITYKPIESNKGEEFIQHGAYAIPIRNSDVQNKTTFYSALDTNIKNIPTNITGANDNEKKKEIINSIYYWLVAEISLDSSLQSRVVNIIASNNKVEMYDKRLNNQLDQMWLSNWKKQESTV